jgi:hypothetical protein
MLKRFFLAVLLFVAAGRAAAVDYTDIWFIPLAEEGWGVNVVQSDNFLFITFFIYGADGKPTWFTGQVTQDASGNFNGTLYSTTGTYYILPWAGFTGGAAGTVSFQPLGPYTATLIYTVSGVGTVTKTIQRQRLLRFNGAGTYIGGQSGSYSNCSMSTTNGPYRDFFNDLQVTQVPDPTQVTDGTVTFAFIYTNFSCTFSGTIERHGQLHSVPVASYQCADGLSTSAAMTEIKATEQGIEGRFSAPSVGGNCREDAQFSGVRILN